MDQEAETERKRSVRRKRRRRAGSYYLKIAVTVVGGMAAAGALFAFMSKVVHPYRLGYQVGQEVAEQRESLERQQRINAQLRARVAYLKSDEGVEREARRAGYHRPGEIVYLMTPEPEKNENAAPSSSSENAPDAAPAAPDRKEP
jgi:cell division protein FtsB